MDETVSERRTIERWLASVRLGAVVFADDRGDALEQGLSAGIRALVWTSTAVFAVGSGCHSRPPVRRRISARTPRLAALFFDLVIVSSYESSYVRVREPDALGCSVRRRGGRVALGFVGSALIAVAVLPILALVFEKWRAHRFGPHASHGTARHVSRRGRRPAGGCRRVARACGSGPRRESACRGPPRRRRSRRDRAAGRPPRRDEPLRPRPRVLARAAGGVRRVLARAAGGAPVRPGGAHPRGGGGDPRVLAAAGTAAERSCRRSASSAHRSRARLDGETIYREDIADGRTPRRTTPRRCGTPLARARSLGSRPIGCSRSLAPTRTPSARRRSSSSTLLGRLVAPRCRTSARTPPRRHRRRAASPLDAARGLRLARLARAAQPDGRRHRRRTHLARALARAPADQREAFLDLIADETNGSRS